MATEDVSRPWLSVVFVVDTPNGKVEAKLESDGARLTRIVLTMGGEKYEIPASELRDIVRPQIRTSELFFGAYGMSYDKNNIPYLFIQLRFGENPLFGEFPIVQYLFHSGQYQSRTITVKTSDGNWQDYEKKRGQSEVPQGRKTKEPVRSKS